jgi:predicted transcriptional regulator
MGALSSNCEALTGHGDHNFRGCNITGLCPPDQTRPNATLKVTLEYRPDDTPQDINIQGMDWNLILPSYLGCTTLMICCSDSVVLLLCIAPEALAAAKRLRSPTRLGCQCGGLIMSDAPSSSLVELTVEIVAAYVSKNVVSPADLPSLISSVHTALNRATGDVEPPSAEEQRPAIAVRKSITPEYIVCLEDGKKFKSLKRHLRTHYNLSPEEYREKWELPHDYPMVAPNYAAARSQLAKKMGLGTRRDKD